MHGIETLPPEILENVCRFMTPLPRDRSYSPLRSPDYYDKPQEPFRADCASMRLACKNFSTLRTLSAALFYDFNVFVTSQSLDRLSQHTIPRNHVRRLVFCRPMFQQWLAQASEYKTFVRRGYTLDEKDAGLRAYNAALKEQERLLGDGIYTKTCGRCVSRFPRLWSIFISDEVPETVNHDSRSNANSSTLLQRQHPKVLLTKCIIGEEFESADHHISTVLRALASTNAPIEELVTHNEWGPSQEFSLETVPGWPSVLDLSKLSRLDLCLRDGKRMPSGADYSSAICPLLRRMPVLSELYLRFYSRENSYPTVAELWKLRIPGLTVLAVEGLMLTRVPFCGFLRRHDRLRQLTLYDVRVTDGQWFSIFKNLREHSELEDLDIAHVDDGRLRCPVSTFEQPELSDEVTLELYGYLHGKGDWTNRLSRYWNDS